jgi:hypothetical protein
LHWLNVAAKVSGEALFLGFPGAFFGALVRLLAVLLCANLVFCAVYAESWSVSANESASGRVSGG